MCGIAGLYHPRRPFQPLEGERLVRLMTERLVHRGPDAEGQWADSEGRCVLGHRRLSIIDISDAGRQPLTSHNDRWVITFNGEIYNFRELKSLIEREGGRVLGRTDTEVLVESLALWGTQAFEKLDGMFAFAAYDKLTGELLLARDAFGEKPLYLMDLADGGLAFASELQALECLPGFDATVDLSAISEVLCFQYIGAPRTIYRKVEKLRPGHWIRLTASGERTGGCFYTFQPVQTVDRPMPDLADELEDILIRSIRRRMIADVPLGAFLSGGVDSSTVCALIRRKLGASISTYSIGFKNEPESEHQTARAFARHLETDHHDLIIEPQAAAGFLQGIGRLLDEPNADSSCLPTYFLSGLARRHVTVAIGGDGGDEMFGGYNRYFATLEEAARHRQGQMPRWTPGAAAYGRRLLVAQEPHIAALFGFVPPDLVDHLKRLRADVDQAQGSLLAAMRRTDVENYLPGAVLGKVDRMSMRHSLEVRTPYLNIEVARFSERLPDSALVRGRQGKLVLREIARRYLPARLIDLPKQGFGLPMSDWARTNLLDVALPMLNAEDGRLSSAFGRGAIKNFIASNVPSDEVSLSRLWTIATLESWLRHHPATIPRLADEQRTASQRHGHQPVMPQPSHAADHTDDVRKPPDVSIEAAAGYASRKSRAMDLSLDAVMSYASDQGLVCFATDGDGAGEYCVDHSDRHRSYRSTGRVVAITRGLKDRVRTQAPFRLFGHFAVSKPECVTSIVWCLDLLKSGYAFAHVPSPLGPEKVSLIAQLARNCLYRLGFQPRRRTLRAVLRRVVRYRKPSYRPEPGRILMITSTYNRGGSERQMIATASGLIQRGYDVRIMALGLLDPAVPTVEAEIRELGMTPYLPSDFEVSRTAGFRTPSDHIVASDVEGLPRIFFERAAPVLAAIRELRPCVVHGWLDVPAIISAISACSLGVPRIVIGLRNVTGIMKFGKYPREIVDFLWEGFRVVSTNPAVAILNNSAVGAAEYESWLGLQRGAIRVLKNGYMPGHASPPPSDVVARFRAQLGWSVEVPVVGTVMRFVEQKDPDLWLKTAAEIAKARPDVRFLLAGYGELQNWIADRIASLGLGDRVVMPGAPTDVGLIYAALDVVLLTSLIEGTPNILVEAQVAGRPVVVTDAGGVRETVSEGRTGRVIRDRSPQRLAAAVINVLDDPAWAARARAEGPAFVATHFDVDRMVADTLEIYGLPARASG